MTQQQSLFAEAAPRFPKRWQDCTEFCDALRNRAYLSQTGFIGFMSEGAYLYMYELWCDGRAVR